MATNEKAINLETLGAFKDEADKAYQAKLTAGENITISEDNVISASGSEGKTYTGIAPVVVDNEANTISANFTVPSDYIVTQTWNLSNLTLASGKYDARYIEFDKPGYKMISIVTYVSSSSLICQRKIADGTTESTGHYRIWLVTRNVASTSATADVGLNITWKKNT